MQVFTPARTAQRVLLTSGVRATPSTSTLTRSVHGLCSFRGAASTQSRAACGAASPEAVEAPPPSAAAAAPTLALSGAEIRARFLQFFEERGHTRLPSSSLVPDDPTVLLTIAGMLQFKPIFLGQAPRLVPCATTTQKCVRTNDIENVGVTARHHTFFEMLGNFSFGDYFKREAISYAWELSTQVFRLPTERVFVSVYEEDDEAYAIWRDVIGVPESRIKRMGAADNFWASGPTGPCGPCSELYYDFHPERGLEGADLEDDSRFIEFYNLVFMEMNRDVDGNLTPLKNKNIDTGMGLERMAQILQRVPNNYETDLIFPIVQRAAAEAGVDYSSADDGVKTSLKVIADHIRAVTYLISDGVIPSNVGRGYIVRRLLRRVVLKGRLLGIQKLFAGDVARVAIDMSLDCDPRVKQSEARVVAEITREEERFVSTIAAGQNMLGKVLERARGSGNIVSGADGFVMYDTFGFPLELTQEVAAAEGLAVDVAGFEQAMQEQRQRSKDAREDVDMTAGAAYAELSASVGPSDFVGYAATSVESSRVLALLLDGEVAESAGVGSAVSLVLDRTPFYAESGGQTADVGALVTDDGAQLRVTDVQKVAGGQLVVHKCEVTSGSVARGDTVRAEIDVTMRRRAEAHHTATHLLQSALKQVLGEDVAQQGSLCNFERLRFDFNLPRPMNAEEIRRVDALVNQWVQERHPLTTRVMALADAKAAGATAMFGEKYDNEVRVVDVPGVSMELCGGTHVSNTAEIGAFKIVAETGIASGIRRVEAVAGPALVEYVNAVDAVVRELSGSLKVAPEALPTRVAAMQRDSVAKDKEIAALRAELALAKSQALASSAVDVNGNQVIVAELEGVDAASLQKAALSLLESLGERGVVVLGSGNAADGKVSLVAACSDAIAKEKKLNAGKFVGALAKICGGGGGGKPGFAQAGGKDVDKLPDALAYAREQLAVVL